MKITNRIISMILCILIISATACLAVSAKTVFPVGDWVYEKINNNTEFEIDLYTGTATSVSTVYYHNSIPITSIGTHAFLDNTTMTSITLSPMVHSIQSQAFLNVAQLETVTFKGDINLIGSYAFAGCKSLKNIALEETQITSVAFSSFMNCDALTEVTLPDTVTEIGSEAFAYCDSLSKITIPASVTSIDEDAFYNTANVVIYCYTDSAAHTYAQANDIEFVLLDQEVVETYICGDTDNDGFITVMDASAIQLILAQKLTDEDGKMSIRGNVDGDESLSVIDASTIQLHLALKLDVETDIGKTLEY